MKTKILKSGCWRVRHTNGAGTCTSTVWKIRSGRSREKKLFWPYLKNRVAVGREDGGHCWLSASSWKKDWRQKSTDHHSIHHEDPLRQDVACFQKSRWMQGIQKSLFGGSTQSWQGGTGRGVAIREARAMGQTAFLPFNLVDWWSSHYHIRLMRVK